jgi:hypothetical protein
MIRTFAMGALFALLLAVVAAPASASVRLETSGELPFTEEQLAEAIALRLQEPGRFGEVTVVGVKAEEDGTIVVRLLAKERRIRVESGDGAQAARRVAVILADMAMPDAPVRSAPAARTAVPAAAAAEVSRVAEPEGSATWRLGVLPTIVAGLYPSPMLGGVLEVAPKVASSLRLLLQVGYLVSLSFRTEAIHPNAIYRSGDVERPFHAVPLRGGVCYSPMSWLELRAGLSGLGVVGRSEGWIFSAFTSAALSAPLGRSVRLVALGGADFLFDEAVPYAKEGVFFWGGLGVHFLLGARG